MISSSMAKNGNNAYNLFFLIFFCLLQSHAAAKYILNQGDTLNSSDNLVSRNGVFTLKLYNITFDGWYLTIWYSEKPCWIANRDRPIKNSSGVLLIDKEGSLTITDGTGEDPIKLHLSQSKTNVSAILQDNGNFVLREVTYSGSAGQILWQSFDSPTSSFFPGMKLGINHITGQNWSLTSWFSKVTPNPGAFTLEWVPSEHQMIIKRRGVRFWSSGVLKNGQFENLRDVFDINFTEHSNKDEECLTYQLINLRRSDPDFKNRPIVSLLSLEYDGTLNHYSSLGLFSPTYDGECDGRTSRVSGCERWKGPGCRMDGDMFHKKEVIVNSPVASNSSFNKTLVSFSDCKDICWNDCKCFGVSGSEITDVNVIGIIGCTLWYEPLKEIANGEEGTISYMIIPGPPASGAWKWIIVAVASIFIVLLLGGLVYLRWRKLQLQEKFLLNLMTLDNPSEAKELEIDGNRGHNLKVFSVSSIMDATNSFSSINKLGEGGFGPVYKGLLSDGGEIAIKRLSGRSGQGLVEFKNELILIAKLQHTNLVRLLGFCIHGEEKMLVYEYMPNKSLDSYIFDQSKRELLDWNKCFNIIEGIAQGLLYLHKYSRLRIIHRDLKASNILLDQNMNPKISDFGMARIFISQSEANTNRIVGTYGYMSPEYAMEGIFSEKSDVFSFGVLLLEIVTGRKNNSFYHSDRPLNLVGHVWQSWKEGAAIELMHPTLLESFAEDRALRCINVALLCVENNPLDRPSMSVVVSMLTSEIVKLPMPKQPAFCFGRTVEVNTNEAIVAENPSINNVTLSVMDGR